MEFFIFVLAVWLTAEWLLRRHYQQKNDKRFSNIVDALNRAEREFNELKKLAARVTELEKRPAAPDAGAQHAAPVVAPSAVRVSEPTTATLVHPPAPAAPPETPRVAAPPIPSASLVKPAAPPATPPPPAPPAQVAPPSAPKPPAPVQPRVEPVIPRPASPLRPTTTAPSAGPVHAAARPAHASVHVQLKSSELEEKLGTNWLNKIGIVALVIGIALFLAYKFPTLSNPEKVGLGYFVSFAILGLGVYLERKDLYRVFARALIGGGWALVFFTTYAMHFVKYTQVIDTEWVDLVLLFAVAWMMVAHTLRYNSQVVTGLAFLLGFTTVAISQNTVYCLGAGAILAIGLVAIVHRRSWFELEVFGLIASYLNHYIWLRTVIEPMGGHKHMFPEFLPSALLLCLYWAIYRWSYLARRIQRDTQEHVSTLAALLNTCALLVLFKYQSVRPELAFYVLLALGAVELTLGQLPVARRRRTVVVILSTIGTVLLVAAIPFKYSGMDMAIIWLAEAQALFLAGVFTRETLFRRFGLLAALLTAGDMLLKNAEPILETRLDVYNLLQTPEYQLAMTFGFAALLFYVNAHWIPRRWKGLIQAGFEETCFRGLSYLAGLMMFVSLWLAFPNAWTAVAWAAAALVVTLLGRQLDLEDLSHQAHPLALASFMYAIGVNRFAAAPYLSTGMSLRLVTLSLVIALFYLCARWAGPALASYKREISEIYTTAAAILVLVVTYYECHWAWMGVTWGAFALVLAVLGVYFERRDLSYQAHAIVLAGFARTLVVNIDATQEYHHFTLRFITFTLMAALLYLCAYFSGPRETQAARVFSAIHTWAGTALVAVLAYQELSSSWIAVTWALFALLLLIAGSRLKRMDLHFQAYLLSFGAVIQVVMVNLYATEPFHLYPRLSLRLVTIVLTAAILYVSSRWAAKAEFDAAPNVGAAYTWAGSLLVWLLLLYELHSMNVALGWAIFGLALFEIGFVRKSVNWRAQGYIAFASAFVRIFAVNINASHHELLVTTLPLAVVFYYAYWRLQDEGHDFLTEDRQVLAGPVMGYLGTTTCATVLYYCLDAGWVAAGWAGLALVLIAVAWTARQDVFLHHSLLLAGSVLFRTTFFDLMESNTAGSPWYLNRSGHVIAAAALLFAAQAFAFPLRSRFAAENGTRRVTEPWTLIFQRPEQFFFFIPLALITMLIAKDVSQGRVTMAWGIEAVAVFLFALIVGERSFRLTGLGLLLLCVGKILVLDVWRQDKSDRFVTFIILGIALLLVSFLYTRYSEAIKRYL
jgi:uncharacterized membrane protein